jgi:hypothetical protein
MLALTVEITGRTSQDVDDALQKVRDMLASGEPGCKDVTGDVTMSFMVTGDDESDTFGIIAP